MVVPKAIGQDAGGDRVVLGDPVGQGDAAFAFAGVDLQRVGLRDEVEHRKAGRGYLGGRLGGVAPFLHEGGLGLDLMRADPGDGKLRHRGDALVDDGELASQHAELLGFGGRGDFLPHAFVGVRRRPGFAVVRVGDFLPFLAVEGNRHLVFAGCGALGVVAQETALRGAVGQATDLFDAGQGDDEFGRAADEPLGAFVTVDRQGGAVGRGEIFGRGTLGALGLGAGRSEGDVAGRRFGRPDLEFRDASAGAALRIGGGRGHREFHEAGFGRRDAFLRQQGVGLGARRLAGGEQGLRLGLDGLGQGVLFSDDLGALLVERAHGGIESLGLFLGRERTASVDHAFEGGADAVVVLGRDGVELMMMATGAVDREAEESASGGGDHVVERGGADDLLGVGILIADVIVRPGDEERAADLCRGVELADHVPGKVFADQLVEGFVLVQRADDVVAERIEVVDDEVAFEAVAFAEADDVEPVTTPVFAVAR